MHHAQHHGYQFNYNGDYSGDVHVIDPLGFEWPAMTLDHMIHVIKDPNAQDMAHVKAFRDFIANAVRTETISLLEQMDTDQVLASPIGQAALAD